ncbi:MAG TPA: hypothetical protein VE152_08060, partial [Acidimicrobiales bacterium]|nr:hypothetical protein [Acidimicrobiales bacterium]
MADPGGQGRGVGRHYGETHPRPVDDRLATVLVVLDGLGDRGCPELGWRTPAEAARTPTLDALAGAGVNGVHLPMGPGRAPSSELAHWSLFGYEGVAFPGRAVLEALGAGLEVPQGVPLAHAALRPSEVRQGQVWLTGRARASDHGDVAELLASLAGWEHEGVRPHLSQLRGGEATLFLRGATSAEVTDTDPFFEDLDPWLRPRAWADATDSEGAARTAAVLESFLHWARRVLVDHPRNRHRAQRGLPPLTVCTTKWAGSRRPLPTFGQWVGLRGAAVTDAPLYRGLADLLVLERVDLVPRDDPGADLDDRLAVAEELLRAGASFVHVHSKAPDEAGHAKDPAFKAEVIEAIDRGSDRLLRLSGRAVVAVTGDHATPSVGGALHSGDPTPLVVAGPGLRPDRTTAFGERPCKTGTLGTV